MNVVKFVFNVPKFLPVTVETFVDMNLDVALYAEESNRTVSVF